jgi:hypothetical protein
MHYDHVKVNIHSLPRVFEVFNIHRSSSLLLTGDGERVIYCDCSHACIMTSKESLMVKL